VVQDHEEDQGHQEVYMYRLLAQRLEQVQELMDLMVEQAIVMVEVVEVLENLHLEELVARLRQWVMLDL
jgi:SepF-like predicted cell division protein (DUF552 family)